MGLIMKELNNLMRDITKITNGQAKVLKYKVTDTDELCVYIEISPNDGLYNGGTFIFSIELTPSFPDSAPKVVCLSPIYHPNINVNVEDFDPTENNVCLNILDSNWHRSIGLTGTVVGLLWLINNPQTDDPLGSAVSIIISREEFITNVKDSLRGIEVERYTPIDTEQYKNIAFNDDSQKFDDREEVEMEEGEMDIDEVSRLVQIIHDQNDTYYNGECVNQNQSETISNEGLNSQTQTITCEGVVGQNQTIFGTDAANQTQTIPGILETAVQPQALSSREMTNSNESNANCSIVSENAANNFQNVNLPSFLGYRLTKHGTTVLPDVDLSQSSPFLNLIKRFTV